MAKLYPVATTAEMEAQLGYNLEPENPTFKTHTMFYSDLTLYLGDLHQRTMREYEMFKKGISRDYKLAPVVEPPRDKKVISSENDSITLSPTFRVGYYEYFADVQYNGGITLRLLLTGGESLAVAAVADLKHSTMSSTAGQAQKCHSTLMSLPLEVRQIIYKHTLGDRCWSIAEPKTWSPHTFCRALGDPSGFYFPFGEADAVLAVSKQIRREALPVAYQGTAMQAGDVDGATAFLMAIGHIGRANITSFQLGWESYADIQINWSKPEISDSIHLALPRLHVPTCVLLLKQCPRLTTLSLMFNNVVLEDISLPEFQSDPGIKLLCSIRNIKRLQVVDLLDQSLEEEAAAKWLREEILGS